VVADIVKLVQELGQRVSGRDKELKVYRDCVRAVAVRTYVDFPDFVEQDTGESGRLGRLRVWVTQLLSGQLAQHEEDDKDYEEEEEEEE